MWHGEPDKLFIESKSSHISNITITYSHPNDEYYDNDDMMKTEVTRSMGQF
jgi:hypothetical protein